MTVRAPTFDGLMRVACVAVGSWIVAGLAVVTAVHLDDRYRIDHVSGSWMALAQYAADGTLYAPLYDGERYGGTRFMPLQILLHSGISEATGEYLVSGKLLTLAITAALLALTFVALRALEVPVWLGVALVAVVVTTHTGLTAMTSIRGDALPVALQLAALLTVGRWKGKPAAVGAGILCTAAVLSKISALWAPAAIIVWLALRDRRRFPSFLASFALVTAAALGLLELGTEGRFSENVFGLATSALEDPFAAVTTVFTKPLTLIDADAAAISIVLPLAFTDLVLAARTRTLVIEHYAFLGALLVTLVLMADLGVVSNHLLDIEVLAILLVGHLWVEHSPRLQPSSIVGVLMPLTVLWAATSTYLVDMHPDVKDAGRAALGRRSTAYPAEPLAGIVARDRFLLSEDPTLAVTSGRHPTVLDPFMLVRVLREHPTWGADLVRRLDRRQFDRVVLLSDHVRPDGRIDVSHPRWEREHFGLAIVAAISRNYGFQEFAGSYAVYAP